jgi:hypothetical protein
LDPANENYREDNRAGDDEPDAGEGERRQRFKTELDKEPRRSPDAAEYEPDETRFHCSLPTADCQLPILCSARMRNAIGNRHSAIGNDVIDAAAV